MAKRRKRRGPGKRKVAPTPKRLPRHLRQLLARATQSGSPVDWNRLLAESDLSVLDIQKKRGE